MDPSLLAAPAGSDSHARRASPTGVRGFAASPRLSLMRSRRDSYETTSSSVSSCSTSSRFMSACVTRQTTPDDCDRHRFIVWTAIQRNSCGKMSPTEKLECPMLRCRRRCSSHEMMLKHLYECEHLSTGEYWCYECEKPEIFTDSHCKRCTGSPGRRRRMLSHAKQFFSSLGNRSKKDAHSDTPRHGVSLDDLSCLGMPSLPHEQAELSSSNEIVEIDSTELSPPPGSHERQDMSLDMACSHSELVSLRPDIFGTSEDDPSLSLSASPFPALPSMSEHSGLWDTSYPIPESNDPIRVPSPASYQERPVLQLNTTGLDSDAPQSITEPVCSTSQLAHSLSLRSNNSATTCSSFGISPASVHSAAWTMGGSVWDTDMTSLSSGMVSPAGYLSRGGSNASRRSCFDSVQQPETIAELPAELPALCLTNFGDHEDLQPHCVIDPPSRAKASRPEDVDLVDALDDSKGHEFLTAEGTSESIDADSLALNVWTALEGDVSDSLAKLQNYNYNPLVVQLANIGAQGVRERGLSALQQLLDDRTPAGELDLLCLVFLVRAMSAAISPTYDVNWIDDLFQCICHYFQHETTDLRGSHSEIMRLLWAPSLPAPEPLSARPTAPTQLVGDALPAKALDGFLNRARLLLDHFEHAILARGPRPVSVLRSDLWTLHRRWNREGTADLCESSRALLLDHVAKVDKMFSCSPDLTSRVNDIMTRIQHGQIDTVRKAELELLVTAKEYFSASEYIDAYTPAVRSLCSAMYTTEYPRRLYHQRGIALLEVTISKLEAESSRFTQDIAVAEPPTDNLVMGMMDVGVDAADLAALNDFLCLDSPESLDSLMTFDVPAQPGNPSTPEETGASAEAIDVSEPSSGTAKTEAKESCKLCGFRPKGDPKWFRGSMAKHMKHQHSTQPPKIYKCPYPYCKSEYRNRPDNLRQHQLEKGHFVGDENGRRPSKRKRVEQPH